jgi:hypothetical protein
MRKQAELMAELAAQNLFKELKHLGPVQISVFVSYLCAEILTEWPRSESVTPIDEAHDFCDSLMGTLNTILDNRKLERNTRH